MSLLALSSAALAAPFKPVGKISLVSRGADANILTDNLCETTPGVTERRGYCTFSFHHRNPDIYADRRTVVTVNDDVHLWFWYFSARNSPTTAPLVTWLNGGPGASSMIGLFQNNGPCTFVNGTTPVFNPYSFNNNVNMLYIDQPAGTGFSYGSDAATKMINSTQLAIPYVYEFLQAFLQHEEFAALQGKKVGVAGASYVGHYGPELVRYIQERNADSPAVAVQLAGLAVNDGMFDYRIQEPAMADYMLEKGLVDQATYDSVMADYKRDCAPALDACDEKGGDAVCSAADDSCYNVVEGPLTDLLDYPYDIRGLGYVPPSYYMQWFGLVKEKLGNETAYISSSNAIFNRFIGTGDTARSFIPRLSEFVSTGVPTLLWVGDQDMLCNYIGVRRVAEAIEYAGQAAFKSRSLEEWAPSGGTSYGLFKTEGSLSYLQVYRAGHNLQFGQPEAGLKAFNQFFLNGTLSIA
ncbi:hypothetical protein N0V90_008458 [Kalmusia sp. IMI 367209]|nr:hypothetical protein N0V90_008458 [Kalmusia sp. IMI 367209]